MIMLHSPAKINLTLDILGRDERTGKHFVTTILYRHDSLSDDIELKEIPGGKNVLICDSSELPNGEENTVLKAMKLLGISGWEITLRKNIPVQSGLGGGSSNAGTILKFFGKQKRIPEQELMQLGKEIGADVPFFIVEDNLAYFEGFGDELVQSWNIPPLEIEIINTGIRVSTKEAYANVNAEYCGKNSAKTEAFLKILNSENLQGSSAWKPLVHNDFEAQFLPEHPELKHQGFLCGSGGFLWSHQSDSN